MLLKIHILPKKGVLDPQGQAVGNALKTLGFETHGVRQGKYLEIVLPPKISLDDAKAQAHQMCEQLLANTVVESYTIDVST
jgi:phosphoribosylformylglycinamidine synthase subunit PurS